MKIAHVIMAYKNPIQIERLIKSMDHPQFYFFLHVDLKFDIKEFKYLENIDRVFFIKNRVVCNWGGYSFVRAIFSSLNEIMNEYSDFSLINLLSGQDYPIKPVEEIYDYYLNNSNKCFISYDENPSQEWWKHAIKRMEIYHLTDFNFKGRYFIQGLMNKILPSRILPLDLKFYGSSDSSWWTITSECARYLVNFIKEHPKLDRFMKYTWGCDEFLIATLIMNSTFKKNVVNNNLRYITWAEGIANPKILTTAEYEKIKSSPQFFARKFDICVDSVILDKIDKLITSN
jgi:hypothetical protein